MNIRIIKDKNLIWEHIKNNMKIYIFAATLFLLGILIGTLVYLKLSDVQELSEYTQNILNRIADNEGQPISINQVFKEVLIQNFKLILIFWLVGASIIGSPILAFYVAYRGFILGFTISTIIGIYGILKGNLIVFSTLFLHNLISIPIIIFLFVSTTKLTYNILRRQKDIKMEIVRHSIICIFLRNNISI